MYEQEIPPEMMEQLEDEQAIKALEAEEDRFLGSQEIQEGYGYPMAEEKNNPHVFLNKAAFETVNTVKTTFLTEEELGRPLFSMRFLLDMEDIAKHYLDPLGKKYPGKDKEQNNKISEYFLMKALNMSDSGMSNLGFAMNLNVTRRMDTTRKRVSEESMKNLKQTKRK